MDFKHGGLTVAFIFLNIVLVYNIIYEVYIYLIWMLAAFIIYRYISRTFHEYTDVQDKCVLITGCDTGFGHDLALKLESLGLTVYAGCLLPDDVGAQTLRKLNSNRMHVLHLDVTKNDHVEQAVQSVKEQNKGLWAVVNNAAIEPFGDIEIVTVEQMKRAAEVNFYGMVRVTKAFIPMIRESKGRFINVTSVKGRLAIRHDVSYNVTKYAGEAFSDILRLEMYKFGVKVIIIEPGHFASVTAMMSKENCDRLENDLKEIWKTLSPEVQDLYGWDYVSALIDGCRNVHKGGAPTSTPVIDSIVDAVLNTHPKYRYLIHGSNKFFDIYCVLAILNSYLPEGVMDWLVRTQLPSPKIAVETK